MDLEYDDVDYEASKLKFDEMLGGRHINDLQLKDAMRMAKDMDVKGFKKAKNLKEVLMCLKLHLLKINEMEKRGREPLKVFSRMKKNHERSCEKLVEIIENCKELLSRVDKDDPLVSDLESSIPGFKFPQTLIEHQEKLQNSECKILVTGEVCAGKTSVVNTLLEERVLPDNFLSNTLTLCEMKYGRTRGAKIYPWDEKKQILIVTDNEDFLKDLARKGEIEYSPEWYKEDNESDMVHVSEDGVTEEDDEAEKDDSITKKFEVVAKVETGPKPVIERKDPEEFLPSIAACIEEKDECEPDNKRGLYKKVDVYLPNELLKDGLTIIDSPGIGDSSRLNDVVTDHLASASGFIYIINSAARGGVQEDRLQGLLRKVRGLKHLDKQEMFRHESAIFVCNQWDLIPVTEHDRLLKDTEEKLRKCWTGLQPEQIIPFSAKEASEIYSKGYMTLEYKNLLDGIEDLIPIGLENKIFFSFRYLAVLLQRLLRQLDGYLNNIHTTSEEKKQRFSELHKRLEQLKTLSNSKFRELKKDVDEKLKEVHKKLKDHLQRDDTIKRLCQWTMDETPGKVYNFDEVYMHIQKIMTARITAEIQKWEEGTQFFEKVPIAISEKFRGFFSDIEKQMQDIQDRITNVKIEVKNTETWKKRDKLDLSPLMMYEKFQSAVKTPGKAVAMSVFLPIVVPLAVVAAIPALVAFGAVAAKGMLNDSQKLTYLSEYSNPKTCLACLRQHSARFLKSYAQSSEHLLSQLKDMMKPAYDIIEELKVCVPELIESDNQQVLSLMRDKRKMEDVLKFYPGFRELVLNLRRPLHHFQVYHMKRNSREVNVHNFVDTKVIDDQLICSGWFTDLKRALLTTRSGRHSKTEGVSLRQIKSPVEVKDIGGYLVEEECWVLHCEKNIAKFIGLSVEDATTIYHILEPMAGNIRSRMRSQSLTGSNPDFDEVKSGFIEQVARQTARGLEYLHGRNLVHFDLTLDSVAYQMIDNKMVVKLTNMSIPKEVSLNPEMSKEQLMKYRYLPFDVLEGKMYTKESDMYSFGLMLWEMVTGHVVFSNEFEDRPINSLDSLMNCIQFCRPKVTSSISLIKTPVSDFDQTWESLMCMLWDHDPKERLSAQKFLKVLNEPSIATGLPMYTDHFE